MQRAFDERDVKFFDDVDVVALNDSARFHRGVIDWLLLSVCDDLVLAHPTSAFGRSLAAAAGIACVDVCRLSFQYIYIYVIYIYVYFIRLSNVKNSHLNVLDDGTCERVPSLATVLAINATLDSDELLRAVDTHLFVDESRLQYFQCKL